MYGIWCAVCGGVTGSREGWMRRDSDVLEFEDRAEAEAETAKTQASRDNSRSNASFRYTVRQR